MSNTMKILFYFALALLLTACATPYQQVGTTIARGYSYNRINEAIFDVSFIGNGFTNNQTAFDYALFRSA